MLPKKYKPGMDWVVDWAYKRAEYHSDEAAKYSIGSYSRIHYMNEAKKFITVCEELLAIMESTPADTEENPSGSLQ